MLMLFSRSRMYCRSVHLSRTYPPQDRPCRFRQIREDSTPRDTMADPDVPVNQELDPSFVHETMRSVDSKVPTHSILTIAVT